MPDPIPPAPPQPAPLQTDPLLPDEQPSYMTQAQFNAAQTARDKRLLDVIEKRFAALAPPSKPEISEQLSTGQPPKADPETIKLREKYEALEKRQQATEDARQKAEQSAARAQMHTTVLAALDAKGVKGAKARAIIADLESQRALSFDEEGKPQILVRRARARGAQPEELSFSDLKAGIDDWAQTSDAQEFLPAPSAPTRPGGGRPIAPTRPIDNSKPAENFDDALVRAAARYESLKSTRG